MLALQIFLIDCQAGFHALCGKGLRNYSLSQWLDNSALILIMKAMLEMTMLTV